ncbi:hypothetical protein BCEP4_770015 [Burkholderia cepacia]|nr:hypothetical protein BCEP4_770015 [Burkholderia cepacia]
MVIAFAEFDCHIIVIETRIFPHRMILKIFAPSISNSAPYIMMK